MKATRIFLCIALLGLWLADCSTSNKPASATGTAAPVADPLAAERAKSMQRVRAYIAGKENMRADSVFQNIQKLKTVTADRLLGVMDTWGKVLGVGCDHCHVPNEWASEVKPEKATTRQMYDLVKEINADLRKLDMDGISCYTCHRGEVHPARRVK
ncbi:MAG: photosynthetic reaction center cytochrome c subunit [Saprospirales bacterium]|nr:photosynthetic reaction center cytochrome c subunit [Saprospirales bacterium]MBK8921601.1 photosynthetic reaction center cytochrome c subunit [Saprospirales bacterium]